ncbi:MAG TPA: DMT family transporter [Stellaceae bacterium]|nr:DMT family transporter [Stellaceae bacterium]
MPGGRFLPLAAAAATGIQVGAAIVATRFVVGEIGPASLALLRYAIGFCCLLPVVLLTRPLPRFAPRDVVPIALLGIAQFGVLVALLNVGLRYLPSGRAALIFATFPLLTMIFAAALGRERLSAAKIIGILLTIIGVGLALGEKAVQRGSGDHQWLGALAVLASAACGALCSVLYRPYLRQYSPLPTGAFAMLASVGFLSALAAGEGFFATPPALTAGGWCAVLFIGVSSGVGYFLWLWALKHAAATNVTIFLALSPITAEAAGSLLLGETVSPGAVLGLLAVLLGLAIALLPAAALSLRGVVPGRPP